MCWHTGMACLFRYLFSLFFFFRFVFNTFEMAGGAWGLWRIGAAAAHAEAEEVRGWPIAVPVTSASSSLWWNSQLVGWIAGALAALAQELGFSWPWAREVWSGNMWSRNCGLWLMDGFKLFSPGFDDCFRFHNAFLKLIYAGWPTSTADCFYSSWFSHSPPLGSPFCAATGVAVCKCM